MLFFSLSFSLQSLPAILLYHSYCEIVCLNLAGPLWACRLFFSQWPNTAIGSFIASLVGSCVPFVFPWVSRARLLSLGFPSPFLNFAFPWAFTKFFGLFWPNYIMPHPWGSWAHHQPFTFFAFITLGLPWPILAFPYHILPMVCFSLFLGSFKFIYLIKAHLFISWTYDPLFLPLRLNGFSIYLPNSFLSMLLGFFFPLGLPKWPSTYINIMSCELVTDRMKNLGKLSNLNGFRCINNKFIPDDARKSTVSYMINMCS